MSIWPPKPEIITSLELWPIATKFPHQIRDFRLCRARQKISQIIATTTDCQKLRELGAKRPHFAAGQFRRTGCSQKPQICRWNCTDIYHTVGDISTSSFVGHIAISGYPSMSHLFVNTFFDFGVVENFVYRARISVILTSDLFGCMSLWLCLCSRWRPITTSGFVRHLENVQIPLFTLLPNHLTIFSLSHLWSLCLSIMGVYNAGSRKTSHVDVIPEVDITIHLVASESPRGL